jgi:hypothetical protein
VSSPGWSWTRALIVGVAVTLGLPGTAVADPSSVEPDTRAVSPVGFGPRIDPYAAYDGQRVCDPRPRPGVVDVRDLVLVVYGPRWTGIASGCGKARPSEHHDGRALDIAFDAHSERDRRLAEDFLGWLLATDQYGNKHAMARRLGVMYIIWNHHIWRSYQADRGWQPYSGTPNPHTDHIHLSFSWDGALRRTTWWTVGPAAVSAARPPATGR